MKTAIAKVQIARLKAKYRGRQVGDDAWPVLCPVEPPPQRHVD